MIHVRHLIGLAALVLALAGCSSTPGSTTGTTIAGTTAGTGTSDTTGSDTSTNGSGNTTGSNGGNVAGCGSCFDNTNCISGYCVQLGHADSFCLDDCQVGCATGAHCQQLNDSEGNTQSVCTPDQGTCSDPSSGACPGGCATGYCDVNSGTCIGGETTTTSGTTGTTSTTSTTGSTGDCGIYAAPNTPETVCHCSATNPSDCQPNNCYGGYYCDTQSGACVPQTTACASNTTTASTTSTTGTTGTTSTSTTGTSSTTGTTTSSTSTGGTSAGAPWSGSVNKNGGSVDRLYFAVTGDSRPPTEDDVSNYPTPIITKIYQDMQSLSVKPQFVINTGDYMYANRTGSTGAQQMQLYLTAQSNFTAGPAFPAMGNHECDGATAGNCTSLSYSNNYQAFMNSMMSPLGQSKPYYRVNISDTNGQWTAKFIFLAINAWDSTQKSWLQTQLADATTYTFIVRHEPSDATTAPGIPDSETVINAAPYTLKIVGHTHEFYHQSGAREVIVGNGGAPLGSPSDNYGYAIVQMLADGNIQVDSMDYQSNASLRSVLIPK